MPPQTFEAAVVLANPVGPPTVGFPLMAAEVPRVASMFAGGEPPVFEEVARWGTADVGWVVAIERRSEPDEHLSGRT